MRGSLRLIPGLQKKQVPAVEVLLNSPYIADRIEKGKIDDIKDVMAKSKEQGMQTFDQALLTLYKNGLISAEDAIRFADSKNNVSLDIRLTGAMENVTDNHLAISPDPEELSENMKNQTGTNTEKPITGDTKSS